MTTTKKAPSTKSKPSAEPPLILVVDDFEDNRAMYVEYLQFQGFRVAEAVNGEDAVARAAKLHPAVVVMDLSLPVMDGWEATRRIKADPKTKDVVVIALTGHAEAAHAKKATEAGCDDFVPKPCLPEQLAEKIREHVESGSTPRSGTKKAQKGKT
jgi:CheY-like chemotaxis protein